MEPKNFEVRLSILCLELGSYWLALERVVEH